MDSPPADLPQYERDLIFESLNLNFNCIILESLLHGELITPSSFAFCQAYMTVGLYTVIVGITLWSTCSPILLK